MTKEEKNLKATIQEQEGVRI